MPKRKNDPKLSEISENKRLRLDFRLTTPIEFISQLTLNLLSSPINASLLLGLTEQQKSKEINDAIALCFHIEPINIEQVHNLMRYIMITKCVKQNTLISLAKFQRFCVIF